MFGMEVLNKPQEDILIEIVISFGFKLYSSYGKVLNSTVTKNFCGNSVCTIILFTLL
jgi:hypothetical protein